MNPENYPQKVKDARKKFNLDERVDTCKFFMKNERDNPLFGAWSCVKTQGNFYQLDRLEIGETWERFGSPNLTRVN